MTQRYIVYTLIDITNSDVVSARTDDTRGYNQQQNLNTLLQLISLRSQPVYAQVSIIETQDLVNYRFGNQFKGLHTVWKLEFASEHTDVFLKDNNHVYLLEHDCDGAAFTANLNETVKFKNTTIETQDDAAINTYFLKV